MHDLIIEYTKEEEKILPSVEKVGHKYICNRCMNDKLNEFYQDQLGVYCVKCISFKKSSTYKQIKRQKVTFELNSQYYLNKKIYLSERQKQASKACEKALETRQDLLVFAVCGAGKTEIIYACLLRALNEGKTVCFATPRKDVVRELVPRFKRDFANVGIIALYGDSPDKNKFGNLYVTTTHQLINFYHYFDLIILDEVDAFPYYNNEMLERFVGKAKKKCAPIIYLTATPTKKMVYLIQNKKLDYCIIPSRYHKHPIPIPRLILTANTTTLINKGILPKKIKVWLEAKKRINKQVFIFVPNITLGRRLEMLMKQAFNSRFVYAESKERNEVIGMFRRGELQFIITTTILERGVTVSNVDVCIIQCDDDIFDERSIVQIVGRAGRDKLFPNADVCLFADYNTLGITSAIRHIKRMNRYASKMRLINRW